LILEPKLLKGVKNERKLIKRVKHKRKVGEKTTLKLQQQSPMVSDNFVQPVISCFDGHYNHWSLLVAMFLRSKKYWHLIKYILKDKYQQMQHKKRFMMNKNWRTSKQKNYLFQAIDRFILWDYSSERYLQADMGLHEQKISSDN